MKLLTHVVILSGVMAVSLFAGESAPPSQANAEQAAVASRLRTQDQMFALLMASYFEVQQDQIDRDHGRRLNIKTGETSDDLGLVLYSPSKTEQHLPNAYRMLVAKERELRMARMAKNMTDMLDLYQSSRQTDQKQIGMSIPSAVDMETAAKQVKQLLAGRMGRPHDPRLWAEREAGVIQAAAPEQRKEKPAVEATLQRLIDAERKAAAAQTGRQHLGLIGTTLFGLPMLRTPAVSRP